jgi:hypothetical protein
LVSEIALTDSHCRWANTKLEDMLNAHYSYLIVVGHKQVGVYHFMLMQKYKTYGHHSQLYLVSPSWVPTSHKKWLRGCDLYWNQWIKSSSSKFRVIFSLLHCQVDCKERSINSDLQRWVEILYAKRFGRTPDRLFSLILSWLLLATIISPQLEKKVRFYSAEVKKKLMGPAAFFIWWEARATWALSSYYSTEVEI